MFNYDLLSEEDDVTIDTMMSSAEINDVKCWNVNQSFNVIVEDDAALAVD